MLRTVRSLGLCVLIAASSAAQAGEAPEIVRVDGQPVMSGVWRILRPASASVTTFEDAKFGPMVPGYCRIWQSENDLETHCVGPSFLWDGTGQIESGKLHLAWGSMMLRMIVDGTLRSPTKFDGLFSLKVSGVVYSDSDPAGGTKVDLSNAKPDNSASAVLLLKALSEIEAGALTEPHDAAALRHRASMEDASPPVADDFKDLGAPLTAFYLGHSDMWDADKRHADFFTAYSVEFANGERVCEIHQTDAGVLDGLICA
jgi:hypothetical protein